MPDARIPTLLALLRAGQCDEATARARHALAASPADAALWGVLAIAEAAVAESAARRALIVRPTFDLAAEALAGRLVQRSDYLAVGRIARRGYLSAPGRSKLAQSLGAAALKGSRTAGIAPDPDGAARLFGWACMLSPEDLDAHTNLSTACFLSGDLAAGWRHYNWRWHRRSAGSPIAVPLWRGEPLDGRLLVCTEQGLGDEILHAGVIPDAIRAGFEVVLQCSPRPAALLRRSFPGAIVQGGERRPDLAAAEAAGGVAAWSPVNLLLERFRPRLEAFPGTPYLRPDPGRLAAARSYLSGLPPGMRIGISWRTASPWRGFNTTLEPLAAALAGAGCQLVNLQYGGFDDEVARLREKTGIAVHAMPGLDRTDDIDGVAALAGSCDVAVTIMNAVGIVAAGVGTPIVMLSLPGFWHSFGTDRYPWFGHVHCLPIDQADDAAVDSRLAPLVARLAGTRRLAGPRDR